MNFKKMRQIKKTHKKPKFLFIFKMQAFLDNMIRNILMASSENGMENSSMSTLHQNVGLRIEPQEKIGK